MDSSARNVVPQLAVPLLARTATVRLLSRRGSTRQGKQRYRCKNCYKTFSTLTGTSLFRMKKPNKWLKYIECMCLSNSLRYAASKLDINLKTAFRWRHRFLKSPSEHQPTELVGIIEADETFVPESFKGSKKMPRKSRKRGGGNPPKVPILLALDRNGAVSHHVLKRNTKEELSLALTPLLSPDSVLCTDGNLSYQSIVKELDFNIDHKRLIGLDNQKVISSGRRKYSSVPSWLHIGFHPPPFEICHFPCGLASSPASDGPTNGIT